MSRREWWRGASHEAKCRQVKAGAEAGLSMRDVAIALGATADAVRCFAATNGLRFSRAARPARSEREHERDEVVPLDEVILGWER